MTPATLIERFPALRSLRRSGANARIPFVQQATDAECGIACLAMVLCFFGRPTTRDDVRNVLGVGRDGASARALADGAKHFGLRARGVRIDVDGFAHLPKASILHWSFHHFLVFVSATPTGISIVDPRSGPAFIPLEEVKKCFTGVAIVCTPGARFEPGLSVAARPVSSLGRMIARTGEWKRILSLSAALHLVSLAIPLLTGVVVDRIVPRGDMHLLVTVGCGLAVVLSFQFVAALVRSHLLLEARTHFDAELTLGLVDKLGLLPFAFFQRRSTGDLMMRINGNVMIREILTSGVLTGVLDAGMMALALSLLMALNASIGLLVIALASCQVAAFAYGKRGLRELTASQLVTQARCQGYLLEMLSGMETLKSLGCERHAGEHYSNLFVDSLNAQLRVGERNAWLEALSGMLRTGAPLLVLAVGTVGVLHGNEGLGTMLAESSLALSVFGPLSTLTGLGAQFESLHVYADRLEDIQRAPAEQGATVVRPAGRLQGGIRLENVTFRYAALEPVVVNDISLSVRPGEFVAIVGRSGSGKSSLAAVMMGLYPPSSGRVLFDDNDLSEFELSSVRQQVGLVTQRTHLFAASVRSNIALTDPGAPFAAIEEAAKLAAVHDEIMSMPMQYNTVLADGGSSLSGGQRQRLALARALVRKPCILLCDEATSALDTITERTVELSLAQLTCTRIVIAHRLSTVVRADRIIVMDRGRIIEQGTHTDLVARGGAYAALVSSQDLVDA